MIEGLQWTVEEVGGCAVELEMCVRRLQGEAGRQHIVLYIHMQC